MSAIDVVKKIKSDSGLVRSIANACGITYSAVVQWDRVPVDRVPKVETVTGIPRHLIRPDRPDLFPPPHPPVAQHVSAG